MSEAEDPYAMILELRAHWRHDPEELERRLHAYYLACCRRIWRLLPQKGSRRGVEVAELYIAGRATPEELDAANYAAEGAAFNIDYDCNPEAIREWVREVDAMPDDELAAMLNPAAPDACFTTRQLLLNAAYFADFAMIYPGFEKKIVPRGYVVFLSAPLLREMFGDPRNPTMRLGPW